MKYEVEFNFEKKSVFSGLMNGSFRKLAIADSCNFVLDILPTAECRRQVQYVWFPSII
jgi:hypothetical protein